MRRFLTLPTALAVLALAGCGGDDETAEPTPTGSAPTAPAPTVTLTTPENTARPSPTPTGNPTFDITLTGENTTPTVGRPWRYVVTARKKSGGVAGGTAKMRVFVGNELVDTIGFFAFDGRLSRTHRWPAVLRGKRGVFLQAEVEGDGGTQRVNFPVSVR